MKNILLFILLLSSTLNAISTLNINSSRVNIENFEVEYFVDETGIMQLHDVKTQAFKTATNKLSIGNNKVYTWIRFNIKNSTNKSIEIYIHNELGYLTNGIEFYEIKNNILRNKFTIDLTDVNDAKEKMYGTDAIFSLNLNPNETKTLYIKNTMFSMQFVNYTIHDKNSSKRYIGKKNTFLLLILGMLIALALYHAMIYLSTKYREYLYYTLYLCSAVVWEFQFSGMMASNFNFYFNHINEYFLLSVFFIPIFLILFSKTIFNTFKNHRVENVLLNSVLFVLFLGLIIGIYDVMFAINLVSYIYIYMFAILLITTYSIMRKGDSVALIFLIGNAFFIIFTFVTVLYYLGMLDYNYFVFNAASFGMVIESLILAFIISYRIRLLKESEFSKAKELTTQDEMQKINKFLQTKIDEEVEKSREKDKMIFHQSKMARMGEMLENIAHQWRQPLSQINSSVLIIDDILYKHNFRNIDIEERFLEIESLTQYLSNTINDFKDFFDQDKPKSSFSLRDMIERAIYIIKGSLKENNIEVKVNINDEFKYYGYGNELQQVIVVILNNAKDVLINRSVKCAKITISIVLKEEIYIINICDNAGGVSEKIKDRIFEPYFTTKHKSQGTGLGLYMSKKIIEESLGGELSTHNNKSGACFEIKLREKNE